LLSSSHSGGFSFVCVYKILCAVPQQLKKENEAFLHSSSMY
jgi:hypothetical protein